MKASKNKRGRRPGTTDTRQTVLAAARARFASDGYANATIRKIAADADVDAALVMQFFGSKDELFAAAMSVPQRVMTQIDEVFAGPRRSLGDRLARTYLALWEDDADSAEPLMAMFRSAVTNAHAAEQLRGFIQSRFLKSATPLGGQPDAALRASLATVMLLGITIGRRVVKVPLLVDEDRETLVRLVAPALQKVLTGR